MAFRNLFFLCFLFPLFAAGQEPSLEFPTSQLGTERQFYSPVYKFWSKELNLSPTLSRKQWEFCYISQILDLYGYLSPGKKGLGFGVEQSPLPALFAKYGCEILATSPHLPDVALLNVNHICPKEQFDKLVKVASVNMKQLSSSLKDFDFIWSVCSLEHLKSLEGGVAFIKESLNCLKKGGIAIYITEFNLSSNDKTSKKRAPVLYGKQDIKQLVTELEKMGYTVLPVNFDSGNGHFDRPVELPPYKPQPSIRLKTEKLTATSIGLVIFNN